MKNNTAPGKKAIAIDATKSQKPALKVVPTPAEPNDKKLEQAKQAAQRDIEAGIIDRVTWKIAKSYGLTTSPEIIQLRRALTHSRHLIKRGNRYVVTEQYAKQGSKAA